MTLGQIFDYLSAHPFPVVLYFLAILLFTLLVGALSGNGPANSPWKYFYSILIYAVSIPGMLALGLSVYRFLFQRGDIMQTNLLLQVLPIVVLIVTAVIIRQKLALSLVPGFGSIYGLWSIMLATMALMWLVDRIRIIVFAMMPFQYLLLIFVALFAVLYFGWRKLMGSK